MKISIWGKKYDSWIISFLTIFVFFIVNWSVKGPTIQGDEGGYLANAAALAGYWVDAASSYHAGYSLLISPAFWFGSEPHTVFSFVKLINSGMWGATALVLYHIIKIIYKDIFRWKHFFIIIVSMLYPAWITLSGYSFSTSAFVLFFTISTFLCLRVLQNGRYWWILWGLSLGYLYTIHPKSIPVIGSAFFVSILIGIGRREWRFIICFFIIIFGMVSFYKYNFQPWLISGMTTGVFLANFHYGSSIDILTRLSNFCDLQKFIVMLSGQIFYITLATLGFVFYPIISVVELIYINLKISKIKVLKNENNPVIIYLFLSFFGTLLMSALFISGPEANRLDHWMYGRYVEGVSIPLLALGLCYEKSKKYYLPIIIAGAMALILSLGIGKYTNTAPFNVSGFWQEFFFRDKSPLLWWGLGAIQIYLVSIWQPWSWRFGIAAVFFMFAIFLQVSWHSKAYTLGGGIRQEIAYKIRNDINTGSCVGFDNNFEKNYWNNTFISQYAFFLYDYGLSRMKANDWYESCDGPLISFSKDLNVNFDNVVPVAVERKNGPFLWIKSNDKNKIDLLNKEVVISPLSLETRLFLGKGWYEIEGSRVWSMSEAEINIPFSNECLTNSDCGLRLSFSVFNSSPKLPKKVLVGIDGLQVADWTITSEQVQDRIIPLPIELLKKDAKTATITFRIPEAQSPAQLGISSDARILGISLRKIGLVQGKIVQEASCQTPQCLWCGAVMGGVPHQVGKQVGDILYTDKKSGYLLFGPYKSMNKGQYILEITGKIITSKGKVVVDVVDKKSSRTFARFTALNPSSLGGKGLLLSEPVALKESTSDLEIRVWVDSQADIGIESYTLRPVK